MSERCTWVGCEALSVHVARDRYGEVWARLCEIHRDELEAAVNDGAPKRVIRSWIQAQGGAEVAAKRSSKAAKLGR